MPTAASTKDWIRRSGRLERRKTRAATRAGSPMGRRGPPVSGESPMHARFVSERSTDFSSTGQLYLWPDERHSRLKPVWHDKPEPALNDDDRTKTTSATPRRGGRSGGPSGRATAKQTGRRTSPADEKTALAACGSTPSVTDPPSTRSTTWDRLPARGVENGRVDGLHASMLMGRARRGVGCRQINARPKRRKVVS